MKEVRKLTIYLTVFFSILKANIKHINIDILQLIPIMLIAFVLAVVIVTVSENHLINKEIAEDINHISNPKKSLMEINDSSLDG